MKTLNVLLLYICVSAIIQVIMGVSADLSLNESIYIGRCRASCLHTFTHPASVRYDVCMKNEDCVMCWSSCRVLGLNSSARSSICADSRACFPGCQTACKFYLNAPSQNLTPPILDSPQSLPATIMAPVAGDGDLIIWRRPKWIVSHSDPRDEDVILYIIMVLIGDKWVHFRQTSSTSVAVPLSVRQSGIKLVAVTSSTGAVAFYEGQVIAQKSTTSLPPVSPTDHPVTMEFQLHDNNGKQFRESSNLGENIDAYSYEDHNNVDSYPPSVTVDYSWRLQLSPIAMDMLAKVEVKWEIRGSGNVDYMVSWTEASGGISGHLLCQQNFAEISVWPRQEYIVQVDLLDTHGNSVLRSVTETLSFMHKDEKKPKRKVTTVRTPRPSTSTVDYDALSASNSKRLLDYFGSQQDISTLESGIVSDDRQDAWPTEDEIQSDWPPVTKPSWIRVNNPLLQDIQNRNSKISSEMGSSSNSLLVWTVCLAVGAILIILLIVLAVRTIRNPKRGPKPFRRAEDGTSDTTVSSTNSSSFAMGSSLSNRSTETSQVEPWTYESFYGVSEHPVTSVTGVHHHHHPLHHCHHQHPTHNSILSHPSFANVHASSPLATNTSAPRIDNASLIENYMLSVDHLPPVRQITY